QPGGSQNVLQLADVELDTAAHRVSRAGRPIHLGPTEFRLLRYLITHPGRVFSREQLLDAVWGHDVYVEARTVDVHIRRLRKALNAEDAVDVVRTVRSAGYALDHPLKQSGRLTGRPSECRALTTTKRRFGPQHDSHPPPCAHPPHPRCRGDRPPTGPRRGRPED